MLVLVTGCVVLYLFFNIRLILFLGVLLGVIGLFMPKLSFKIVWLWYKLAELLGFVMSKVLLSIVFFIFLFPVAMLARLFRPDGLQLQKKAEGSYYIERNYIFKSKDLKNPW